MLLFDYECCGVKFDQLVDHPEEVVKCPKCGKKANKLLGFGSINDRFELKQKIRSGDLQLPD